MNNEELTQLTAYLHEHIPLTAHLGADVIAYDGRTVRLRAPLAQNINHRSTAFGGSLSAVAILSGWTLLYLKLKEAGIANQLVIQKSSFDFSEPVDGDFEACCSIPEDAQWERFLKTLKRHKRARISVASEVTFPSGKGGVHEGVYVAIAYTQLP